MKHRPKTTTTTEKKHHYQCDTDECMCLTVWKLNSQSLIEQNTQQCEFTSAPLLVSVMLKDLQCAMKTSLSNTSTHTERSASSPLTIQLLQSMDDDALSEALIRKILINI